MSTKKAFFVMSLILAFASASFGQDSLLSEKLRNHLSPLKNWGQNLNGNTLNIPPMLPPLNPFGGSEDRFGNSYLYPNPDYPNWWNRQYDNPPRYENNIRREFVPDDMDFNRGNGEKFNRFYPYNPDLILPDEKMIVPEKNPMKKDFEPEGKPIPGFPNWKYKKLLTKEISKKV